jgi:carboxyl-terminal processing protease
LKNKTSVSGTWILVSLLVIAAFIGGARLRDMQAAPEPLGTSAQANAILKLTPEWSPTTLANAPETVSANRELVSTVIKLLKAHYVEPITSEKETSLARGAVRGMLDSLKDPDSRFLDPTERKLLDNVGTGRFEGIGAVMALREEKIGDLDVTKLLVVAPMPGSPAQKAGIQSGDSITYVDNKWIITHDPFKEVNLDKLAKAVRNKEVDELAYQKTYEAALKKLKEGLTVTDALEILTAKTSGLISLKLDRPGVDKPIEVKIQCANTRVDPVTSSSPKPGIAYIRISQFNPQAVKEFDSELKRALAGHAKGLILDLRDNPGGLIDSATGIASKITGGGVMANVENNSGRQVLRAPRENALKLPVAVLVNSGTASVSELVAGTLRDRNNAVIVGIKTFGDGLIQTPLLLKDGSAAILTTGKMLTAKGLDFDRKGIQPDDYIKQIKADSQLEEAVKVLQAKIGKA